MLGLQALFFYIFALIAVGGAGLMVVASRSPVHSVLFLILTFVAAQPGLFLLAGAEFLALILIVVYVGAVAILFLFVVMMLDLDMGRIKHGAMKYAPGRRGHRAWCYLGELIIARQWQLLRSHAFERHDGDADAGTWSNVSNIQALGNRALHPLRAFLPTRRARSCSSP